MQSQPMPSASALHALTPIPPRGWNSFDSYGCFINERRALANLDVFARRLRPHGYDLFVIDAGWFRNYDLGTREFPTPAQEYTVELDAYGRPVPAKGFFPDGLLGLSAACARSGVKFGIHMMRGIPREAVRRKLPILGTDATADQIADTSSICTWCPDNFGVNMQHPAAQAYYDSLIALLASWGVQFIKYDDIVPSPREVDAVVDAIARSGAKIALSLSPGNRHQEDGWPSYARANMVRTTRDIWDLPEDILTCFERWRSLAAVGAALPRGCWMDMDMIPFGELVVWKSGPAEGVNPDLHGKGTRRMSRLTEHQQRTFMSMRALSASPLFMGGDLTTAGEDVFAKLCNPEVLACSANGTAAALVADGGDHTLWHIAAADPAAGGWVGVFNHHPGRTLTVDLPSALREIAGRAAIDAWEAGAAGTLQDLLRRPVPPDGCHFLRYLPHAPSAR